MLKPKRAKQIYMKSLFTVKTKKTEEKCTNINFKSMGGLSIFCIFFVLYAVILILGTCGNDYSPRMILKLALFQPLYSGTFIDQSMTGKSILIRGKFNSRDKYQCKYCLLKDSAFTPKLQ